MALDLTSHRSWESAAASFDPEKLPDGSLFLEWPLWGPDGEHVSHEPGAGSFHSACDETGTRTTVMIRNVPNDYSRDMLLRLLDENSFACCYDFVYYPIDFKRGAAFGYVFVNMISHEEALRVHWVLQGFGDWEVPSRKVVDVCWGYPIQGWGDMVERYRNSPVMHEGMPDECKPAVFCNGARVPFPPPTKRIRNARRKTTGPPTIGAGRDASGRNWAIGGW